MVLKNRSNEIRTNEIRIRREPSVFFFDVIEFKLKHLTGGSRLMRLLGPGKNHISQKSR